MNQVGNVGSCLLCDAELCNNPVTTSFCAHTFCLTCLTNYISESANRSESKQGKRKPNKAKATQYQCPICASINVLPPGGVSSLRVNTMIEDLARNHVEMQQSITALTMFNNSTEVYTTAVSSQAATNSESVPCCQCIFNYRKLRAERHCKKCHKAVCNTCFIQLHQDHPTCTVEEGTALLIDAYTKRLDELEDAKQVLRAKISKIESDRILDGNKVTQLIEETIKQCDNLVENVSNIKLQAVAEQNAYIALQSRNFEEHLVLLRAELLQYEKRVSEVIGIIERSKPLEMSCSFNKYFQDDGEYEYVSNIKTVQRELNSEQNLVLNKIRRINDMLMESTYDNEVPSTMLASVQGQNESRVEHLLLAPHVKAGQYLDQVIGDKHILSVRYDNEESNCAAVKHYEITVMQDRKGFQVEQGQVFLSKLDLLEHYKKDKGGLCCLLTSPFKSVQQLSLDSIETPRKSIVIEREIASANHSVIYRGKLNLVIDVAIKQAKINSEKSSVVREARMIQRLNHENIIKILAICTSDNPALLVLEYMANGCLLDKLRQLKSRPIDQCPEGWNNLRTRAQKHGEIVSQVTMALSYLEKQRIVHGDLRAANVLLDKEDKVKVSDFELSLDLSDPYFMLGFYKTPIRWAAPEVILDCRFSAKSDVWSFGVLIYEMVTMGSYPYASMTNQEVTESVHSGYCLPNPHDGTSVYCPPLLYQLLLKTWSLEPQERPGFDELVKQDFAILMTDTNFSASSDRPKIVKPENEYYESYKPSTSSRKLDRCHAFRIDVKGKECCTMRSKIKIYQSGSNQFNLLHKHFRCCPDGATAVSKIVTQL